MPDPWGTVLAPWVAVLDPWVAMLDPWVAMLDPWVGILDPWVQEMNSWVGRRGTPAPIPGPRSLPFQSSSRIGLSLQGEDSA